MSESIKQIDVSTLSDDDLRMMADLYADVFADEPWNECTLCVGCGKNFGRETEGQPLCPCGRDEELLPFYPQEPTMQYIVNEGTQDGSAVFVNLVEDQVIGFTWGYTGTVEKFIEEKYQDPENKKVIADILNQNNIESDFFYFSEIGVPEAYRGQGISNELAGKMFGFARDKKLPVVLRTNCESPLVVVANRFGMTQVMGPRFEIVRDENDTTIQRGEGFINDIADSEIEDRVLFVLQSDQYD